MKSVMERADATLLRALLKDALGTLDTIAAEPPPGDSTLEGVTYRAMARTVAKRIRDQLFN